MADLTAELLDERTATAPALVPDQDTDALAQRSAASIDDGASCESLKILHVFRAPIGGLFRHVLDVAHGQVARGHRVGLIVDSMTGAGRAEAALAELAPRLAFGIERIAIPRQLSLRDLPAMRQVARRIAALKPDVLHGHGATAAASTACSSAFSAGAPISFYLKAIMPPPNSTAWSAVRAASCASLAMASVIPSSCRARRGRRRPTSSASVSCARSKVSTFCSRRWRSSNAPAALSASSSPAKGRMRASSRR